MPFFHLTAAPGASVSPLPGSSDRDLHDMHKEWDPTTRVRCSAPAPLPDLLSTSGRLLASPALAALFPAAQSQHRPLTVEDRDGGEHAYVFLRPSTEVNAISLKNSTATWRNDRKYGVLEAACDLVPLPDNVSGLATFRVAYMPEPVWVSAGLADALRAAGFSGVVLTPVEEARYEAPPRAADHEKRVRAWKKAAKAAGTEAGRTAADPPHAEELSDYIDGAWHQAGVPALEAADCADGVDAFEAYDAFFQAMAKALARRR